MKVRDNCIFRQASAFWRRRGLKTYLFSKREIISMKFLKSRSKEIKELQPEEPGEQEKAVGVPEQPDAEGRYQAPARLPEIRKLSPKPLPRMPAQSPPIFIKVEKYREIVGGMRDLRSYILNLRDTLDVLVDMQKELANGIEIAHKTLDELSTILSNLDALFIKPQGMESRLDDNDDIGDMEGRGTEELRASMSNVYGHLEKLRAQLKAIS
jgi:hypothetical protein